MSHDTDYDNTASTLLCLREAYKYGLTHEVLMSFCKELDISTEKLAHAMNCAEGAWIK
jgi:hypothetical protein